VDVVLMPETFRVWCAFFPAILPIDRVLRKWDAKKFSPSVAVSV
jgi:hypothetical protein